MKRATARFATCPICRALRRRPSFNGSAAPATGLPASAWMIICPRARIGRAGAGLFIAKGGQPGWERPHYLVVGACSWLREWYVNGSELRIPLSAFRMDTISFTYGDTFPALRYQGGNPYRGQVYTLSELPGLIETYGLPQVWNAEGTYGPDRYIEAQVWDDEPLRPYLQNSR